MTRRWVYRLGAAAFVSLSLLGIANCGTDVAAPPTPAIQSETAPETDLLGLRLPLLTRSSGEIGDYTLIREPVLSLDLNLTGTLLSVVQLVGPEGGTVSLLGHSVTIPKGALTDLTLVTVSLTNLGYVEVDLTATVTGLLGRIINVGEKGFRKPVTLTMTYSRATNVTDPDKLLILRRLSGDKVEPLKSVVDKDRMTVTVQLDHFSRYCMASN